MIKLRKVEINKYKSFLEKQEIDIEDGVTRVVGKNESGKTALLEAMAKFNYFDSDDDSFNFNSTNDYPRGLLKKYQQEYPNDDFAVISCTFEISDELLKQISDDIGKGVYTDKTIQIAKKYNNGMTYTISADCKKFIENFLQKYTLETALKESLLECNSVKELANKLNENEELQTIYNELKEKYIDKSFETFSDVVTGYIAKTYIKPNLPQFLYFDEYYALPGTINLNKFANGQVDDTFSKEQQDITKALFELSNIDISKVMNSDDYEDFIAELEATSNNITDKLLEYWNTNQNLEIKFEIQTKEDTSNRTLEKFLQIRIRNTKHRVTLPLKNRSKGFIWFFSFLVWFSKVQEKENLIILLDEPGLNLHAEAQSDLLEYIDKELLQKYQVIYTTHSPFMIESDKLDEVRTVYDSNNSKIGSVISNALEEKDQGTLFPLQAALGYNLAQNLYISDKNLLVEGVADLMYLTVISGILNLNGKVGLSDDVTIVPVGGLDKVATFISLLRGNKLNMVCLLDTFTDQKGKKRLEDLIKDKIIKENQVKFFDQYIDRLSIADIEDMFEIDEYLNLFNKEFDKEFTKINSTDIDNTKAIIPQINKIINRTRFNHYRPSRYLTSLCVDKDYFSNETLNRFENLFKDINNLLNK
ncbi:MAG: AAA family ATPase [Clostridia bacterium]|nr:AAA family ATPase [Clostridia bacterium]